MWGADHQQSGMFSYISAERRVPEDHPLRAIRAMIDVALPRMWPQFDAMYAKVGRHRLRGCRTWHEIDGDNFKLPSPMNRCILSGAPKF